VEEQDHQSNTWEKTATRLHNTPFRRTSRRRLPGAASNHARPLTQLNPIVPLKRGEDKGLSMTRTIYACVAATIPAPAGGRRPWA